MKTKPDQYQCVIIDDEPLAIKVIEEHLENLEEITCAGTFTNPAKAYTFLNSNKVELIFLDINMPGISGLDFIKSFAHPPNVIFTTAYRNFAVDAFELDAVDYLVKPISLGRFLKALTKFLNGYKSNEVPGQNQEHMIFRENKINYKIPLKDILAIESMDNYLKVHTVERQLTCYGKLADLEEILPITFLRIHRSYIINIHYITSYTATTIMLKEHTYNIGRNYKGKVEKVLEGS